MESLRTKIVSLMFLTVAVGYVEGSRQGLLASSPPPPICSEVCSSSACGDECYENLMEFENGNSTTCLAYGTYDLGQECCGDGVCELNGDTEDCGTCSDDCGTCLTPPTCGLYGCEDGENCQNCAQDCGSCGSASSCDYDGKCEDGEGKDCQDCMATGFCTQNSDCPTFQGGSYVYACLDDRCVLQDLPTVTTTCQDDTDCDPGFKCEEAPSNYHGSSYSCFPLASPCRVCIPRWVR